MYDDISEEDDPFERVTSIMAADQNCMPLVRTFIADDAAFAALLDELRIPDEYGNVAAVSLVEDPRYAAATVESLTAEVVRDYEGQPLFSEVLVADERCLIDPSFPLLALNLLQDAGHQQFRIAASELSAFYANMSIGNMDFDEWAREAGEDGVFRGFRGDDGMPVSRDQRAAPPSCPDAGWSAPIVSTPVEPLSVTLEWTGEQD
ncbi:hypothetical protein BIV25_44840 [Streptomyces sp. MUSC 14]|uniref:DUF6924 domain-containing protein n=1 Tax=Streptomyces sp. MUSC 14 TaxID=1354889 RepID=UPI0008F58398|nr:hypothetical protein [Streptomyces sp. MUSC 14]OIJ85129.1 hypothetical protein BIV25_44840 [Streptomyces sp. MUSC 14]